MGTEWRIRGYVAAVVALAIGAGLWVTHAVRPDHPAGWQVALLLAALVFEAEVLQVRYHYNDQVESLNLVEAAVAPAIWGLSGHWIGPTVAVGMLAAAALRARELTKAVFNVAQWALAASAGALVLQALRDGDHGIATNVVALVVAILTVSLVNQLAMAGVMLLVSGHVLGGPLASAGKAVITGRLLGVLVALTYGVVLTAAFTWSPWVLVTAVIPQALLHWASRGYASARIDQARLAGLQQATHVLAATLNPAAAYPELLRTVRTAFEVRAADLALFRDLGSYELHRLTTGGYEHLDEAPDGFLPLLHDIAVPTRVGPQHGEELLRAALQEAGWQDALVLPLHSEGRLVGQLCLYDRTGMVAFEDGELAVASAIAAEVVGFLDRTALVESLRDERRKMADIIGSTSDGILTLAADGTIDSWNSGMAAITGYPAGEMVGTAHFGQLRPRDAAGNDLYLEHWAGRDSALPTEMQVITASGDTVWLSCSYTAVPTSDGRPGTCIIVARNVTQARDLERLKDDFVAVVSHELRTPLSSIKGWTNTLITRRERMTPEQQADGLQAISRQAHRLEQLVLNILEASRIEAGMRGADETVDISHVVRKVVEDVTALYPSRAIRATGIDTPTLALAQHVWVERSVANLLFNAVKYSPEDQPVDVQVDWVGTEVSVVVTDRGTGIPKESTERIFQRFERLPGAQTQTGTGLGLYITRQLVAAMNGTVDVQPNPAGGSVFTLRLQAAALRVPEQSRTESWTSRLRLVD